jgi:hypothetical protein
LLPWYVNDTLDGEERALVDAHLAECSDCRSELEQERALAREVASLPVDAERRWAALADRLAPKPIDPGVSPVALLHRRVTLGWALAGQLAVAAALVLAVYVGRPAVPQTAEYVALGTNTPGPTGNVVVLFNPETSEKDIRSELLRLQAKVVDGPTASGAYILRVADGRRAEALKALRGTDRVLLAEPLDLESDQ